MSHPVKRPARRLALAIALAIAAHAGDARADTATAQALFDQAKQLMAQGKHAEACPKLEESQRLDPGMGTQFNLATCYQELGRTASAWSLFLEVAGAAKAAGQAEREKLARQRAAALEPKLVRLTITAPADAPSALQVTRDGVVIGPAQWGTPVPVDPGPHEIVASAPGKGAFRKTVELATPGASETVAIELGTGAPAAGPATPPAGRAEPDAPRTRRNSTTMMVLGIVSMGVGVVAGGAGGVWLGVCAGGRTTASGETVDCTDKGKGAAFALVVAGVAGIAVGIPLTVVGARKVPVDPAAASAAPTLLVGPGGAALRFAL